jgi:hypothetical protein
MVMEEGNALMMGAEKMAGTSNVTQSTWPCCNTLYCFESVVNRIR